MYKKVILLFCFSFLFISSVLAANAQLISMNVQQKNTYQTELALHFSKKPLFEVIRNLEQKVITIKLLEANFAASFRANQILPMSAIERVKWKHIGQDEVWLQLKLRSSHIKFDIIPQTKESTNIEMRFLSSKSKKKEFSDVKLLEMTREVQNKQELLIFTFNKPFQYSLVQDKSQKGSIVHIQVLNADLEKGFILSNAESLILSKITAKKNREYLSLSFFPKTYTLNIKHRKNNTNFKLYVTISLNLKKTVEMEDQEFIRKQKQYQNSNKLKKPDVFMVGKFQSAEELYRNGQFQEAGLLFRNISNFKPHSELGVRANFRAADSFYEVELQKHEKADTDFIVSVYNTAISAALQADKGFEDMPRAYYNMGRAKFKAKFYEEALSYYEVLRVYYRDSPFTQQALFDTGILELKLKRYAASEVAFGQFIQQVPMSPLVPIAYYKLGEVQFQQRHYALAELSFSQAEKLDHKYGRSDASLLFHIAETYYQTKDYDVARSLYEEIDVLFPNQKFSNLVAIRLGDLLSREDKKNDAILAYERATDKKELELYLLAKMNIAHITVLSADKEAFQKALDIYNLIIKNYPLSSFVSEARLRKGLLLGMFHYYKQSLHAIENFCRDYPKNPYVKYPILRDRQRNLLSEYLVHLYKTKQYMELLGIFEEYNRAYYLHTSPNACQDNLASSYHTEDIVNETNKAPLFQIADAYYQLHLYKQSIVYFDKVLKNPNATLLVLALVNKGRALQSLGEFVQAQKIYESIIEKYPDSVYVPIVKKLYGDANLHTQDADRIDKTVKIYRQTIKDYENTSNLLEREIVAKTWYALAKVYESVGKNKEAIYAYQETVSNYEHPLKSKHVLPYIVDSFFAIGSLLFQEKSFHEALEAYNKAIEYYPKADQVPWAKYHKAEILIEYGKNQEALDLLNILIKNSVGKGSIWLPLVRKTKQALVNDMNFKNYLSKPPSPGKE